AAGAREGGAGTRHGIGLLREDSEPAGRRARRAQAHPGAGVRRFRRPGDQRLAARPGGPARRTRGGRVHRLSMVPARPARFLVADARGLGRGGGGNAGRGRQSFRVGWRHGDPQGGVLSGARSRILAGRVDRRLHAQRSGARRRARHRIRSGRAHPVPRAHYGRAFLRLDPPPDGDHADLRPTIVVARPDGAHLLLRRNGGVRDCVDPWQSSGGVGADRATFARDGEGPESRDAGQGLAAGVRGVVPAAHLGARLLGATGDVGVADRAGFVSLCAEYRVARAAVCAAAPAAVRAGGWDAVASPTAWATKVGRLTTQCHSFFPKLRIPHKLWGGPPGPRGSPVSPQWEQRYPHHAKREQADGGVVPRGDPRTGGSAPRQPNRTPTLGTIIVVTQG